MSSLYSPSTVTKSFGSVKPINTTKLAEQLQGYNPSLSNVNLGKGDKTTLGEIKAVNCLFGVKSCLVSGKWYNERDLIPVNQVIKVESISKVNFVLSFVMSIISVK